MQAISKKKVQDLFTYKLFQTQHFSGMISFTCKHSVLSIWHKRNLYFIMYIYLTTTCFNLCRSSLVNVLLRTKAGQPEGP
jgi:hypothetical protein